MLIPPILLTIFNRPKHTAQVIDALRRVKPSRLFIHADGPRDGVVNDQELCEAARNEIRVDWECEIQWKISASNLGCIKGMYEGISWFFEQVEAGVVLEDDCVAEPSFFTFCGELLEKYKNDSRIFGISGNSFLAQRNLAASYSFLKTTHIRGWATWRRSWQMVDIDATEWPALRKPERLSQFLHDPKAAAFWSHILNDLHSRQGNTWSGAIIYTMLKHDMLGIHPRSNLVSNYSFGATGVHIPPKDHTLSLVPTLTIDFPLAHPGFVNFLMDFDQYVKQAWNHTPAERLASEKVEVFQAPNMGEWIRRQVMMRASVGLETEEVKPTLEPSFVELPASGRSANIEGTENVNDLLISAPNMGDMIRQQTKTVETKLPEANYHPQQEQLQQQSQRPIQIPDLQTLLSLDNQEFVPAAYRSILLRDPDVTGLSYYGERLHSGVSRTLILGQIALAGETETARKFYSKLRIPYLVMQARKLPVIGGAAELVCAFCKFHLREFLVGDEQMFIEMAYPAVLGRPSDPEGRGHYLSRLKQGVSRLEILVDMKLSREGKQAASRVAGLSVLAGFMRFRRLPVIRQVFDILAFPSAVTEMLRHARATELALLGMRERQGSDLDAIKSSLNMGHQLVRDLTERLDNLEAQSAETLGLIYSGLVKHAEQSDARMNSLSCELQLFQQAVTDRQIDHSANQTALFGELSASLPRLAENIRLPLMARLTLVDRMQQELRRQIDRHFLSLNARISEEFGRVGAVIPELIEDSRQVILDGLKNTDKSLESLGNCLMAELADSEARVNLETLSVGSLVLSKSAELVAVVNEAGTEIGAKLDQVKAESLVAQDALGRNLSEVVEASALRISKESSVMDRRMLVAISELSEGLVLVKSGLNDRLEQVKFESSVAQEAFGRNLLDEFSASALRISEESLVVERRILAAISELADSLSHAESGLKDRLEQVKFESSVAQETLGHNLSHEIAGVVVGINHASQEADRRVQAAAAELAAVLRRVEAGLSVELREAVLPLHASIPQAIESAHSAVARLLPQLGRIELYSMTAARRVAIRCGADAVLVRTVVGYLLCSDSDHALVATLVETGDLEPGTRQLIQRLLGPGDTFVDVGANVGMHTLAAARAMNGQGMVVALEPHPQTSKLLAQSIWMNGFSHVVQIHAVAAAGSSGERNLYMGMTSGHHSLFPLETVDAVDLPAVKVRAVTVDQIFPKNGVATLIKIDAEGAELEVLKGALSVLKRSPDIGIIAEFGGSHLQRTGTGAQAWLNEFTQLGFEYRAVQGDTGSLREISVEELNTTASINLFFARPKSPLWQKAEVVR